MNFSDFGNYASSDDGISDDGTLISSTGDNVYELKIFHLDDGDNVADIEKWVDEHKYLAPTADDFLPFIEDTFGSIKREDGGAVNKNKKTMATKKSHKAMSGESEFDKDIKRIEKNNRLFAKKYKGDIDAVIKDVKELIHIKNAFAKGDELIVYGNKIFDISTWVDVTFTPIEIDKFFKGTGLDRIKYGVVSVPEIDDDDNYTEYIGKKDGKYTLLSDKLGQDWDEGFDTVEELYAHHRTDTSQLKPVSAADKKRAKAKGIELLHIYQPLLGEGYAEGGELTDEEKEEHVYFMYRDGDNYKFYFALPYNEVLESLQGKPEVDQITNHATGAEITYEELRYTKAEFFNDIIERKYNKNVDHDLVEVIGFGKYEDMPSNYEAGGIVGKKCNTGLHVQTLLFSKNHFTKAKVKSWLKKHDFKYGNIEESENNYFAQQEPSGNFTEDSFRTTDLKGRLPEGIQARTACPVKKEDGGSVIEFTDLSYVVPSKIETEETQAMGYPDKLRILYNGKRIAQFYYNMRGYNQDFSLKNKENVGYGFGGDRSKTEQVREFKKALKDGFVFIRPYYAEGGELAGAIKELAEPNTLIDTTAKVEMAGGGAVAEDASENIRIATMHCIESGASQIIKRSGDVEVEMKADSDKFLRLDFYIYEAGVLGEKKHKYATYNDDEIVKESYFKGYETGKYKSLIDQTGAVLTKMGIHIANKLETGGDVFSDEIIFTTDDNIAAHKDGWAVSYAGAKDGVPHYELIKVGDKFLSFAGAVKHVIEKAKEGSKLHEKALAFIKAKDPVEWNLIVELSDKDKEFLNAISAEKVFNTPELEEGGKLKRGEIMSQTASGAPIIINPKKEAERAEMIKWMGRHRFDTVLDKTTFADGLKQDFISDFKKAGHRDFANLTGDSILETKKYIQKSLPGFASGKYTYLQAEAIANAIHSTEYAAGGKVKVAKDKPWFFGSTLNEKFYQAMQIDADKDKQWAEKKVKEVGREWKEASGMSREMLNEYLDKSVEELAREKYNYLRYRAFATGSHGEPIDKPAKERWEKITGETIIPYEAGGSVSDYDGKIAELKEQLKSAKEPLAISMINSKIRFYEGLKNGTVKPIAQVNAVDQRKNGKLIAGEYFLDVQSPAQGRPYKETGFKTIKEAEKFVNEKLKMNDRGFLCKATGGSMWEMLGSFNGGIVTMETGGKIDAEVKKEQLDKHAFITKEPLKLYRGTGGGLRANFTYVSGIYLATTPEFASKFGRVDVFVLQKGSKVFDFDTIKNGDNPIPMDIRFDPDRTSEWLIERGYDATRNTNVDGVEYVVLNWKKYRSANKLPIYRIQSQPAYKNSGERSGDWYSIADQYGMLQTLFMRTRSDGTQFTENYVSDKEEIKKYFKEITDKQLSEIKNEKDRNNLKQFYESYLSGDKFETGGSIGKEIKKGDLVFCPHEGQKGLVGLVISDLSHDGEINGYDVYLRGMNGLTQRVDINDMDEIYTGGNYLDSLDYSPMEAINIATRLRQSEDNGDLMHYSNIAKRLGIELNPKYQQALDSLSKGDEFETGGTVNWFGGESFGKDPRLASFDKFNLDDYQYQVYTDMVSKGRTHGEALQLLINQVEGDYSQLGKLAKIAKAQDKEAKAAATKEKAVKHAELGDAKTYKDQYGGYVKGYVSTWNTGANKYAGLPIVYGIQETDMPGGTSWMIVGGILVDGELVNTSEAHDDWFGDEKQALDAAKEIATNENAFVDEFAGGGAVKANWGTEGDMEQLNGLMQGNAAKVKRAKEIYESLSKAQKDKFHSYWVEANSDFGEDLYSGKKVTTATAIKTIKYLLYEQDIAKHAEGGEVKEIVVSKISDIPGLQKTVDAGSVTYRGLGIGKLSSRFWKASGGQSGTRIKVDGKEYYITDDDFRTLGGIKKIRFAAPYRRGYAEGGNVAIAGMENYSDYGIHGAIKKVVNNLVGSGKFISEGHYSLNAQYDGKDSWKLKYVGHDNIYVLITSFEDGELLANYYNTLDGVGDLNNKISAPSTRGDANGIDDFFNEVISQCESIANPVGKKRSWFAEGGDVSVYGTDAEVEKMYLDYVNNFLTVDAFAEHYNISKEKADRIIELGREINGRLANGVVSDEFKKHKKHAEGGSVAGTTWAEKTTEVKKYVGPSHIVNKWEYVITWDNYAHRSEELYTSKAKAEAGLAERLAYLENLHNMPKGEFAAQFKTNVPKELLDEFVNRRDPKFSNYDNEKYSNFSVDDFKSLVWDQSNADGNIVAGDKLLDFIFPRNFSVRLLLKSGSGGCNHNEEFMKWESINAALYDIWIEIIGSKNIKEDGGDISSKGGGSSSFDKPDFTNTVVDNYGKQDQWHPGEFANRGNTIFAAGGKAAAFSSTDDLVDVVDILDEWEAYCKRKGEDDDDFDEFDAWIDLKYPHVDGKIKNKAVKEFTRTHKEPVYAAGGGVGEPKFKRGDYVGWKSNSDFTKGNKDLPPMRVTKSVYSKEDREWMYVLGNVMGSHAEYELEAREAPKLADGGNVEASGAADKSWKRFFANPQRFMRYDGQFLYPPRIEHKLQPASLDKLDTGEYIGQCKFNGSSSAIMLSENSVVVRERHGTPFGTPPKVDFQSLHRGEGYMCITGEFMNKSQKDHTGQPFRGFVIWDIIAFDGLILIGSTIKERIALLEELYPSMGAISVDGIDYAYKTGVPDIYRAANFYGKFTEVYDKLTKMELGEGIALKRVTGRLESCNSQLANSSWQIKCRKSTKNYIF